jgi:hypothetical protein
MEDNLVCHNVVMHGRAHYALWLFGIMQLLLMSEVRLSEPNVCFVDLLSHKGQYVETLEDPI